MIRLLNAGFTRLRKNKIFWISSAFSVILALGMVFMGFNDIKKYNSIVEVEQLMLNYSIVAGIVIAVFTSLFLGSEYSDGAIRNKVIIGHKRPSIYLSNLTITIAVSLFLYLLFIAVAALVGIPLLGQINMELSLLASILGCIFVAVIAYAGIFTFLAMIISNKTTTAIVSILSAFVMLMFALTCTSILEAPENILETSIVNGEFESRAVPNPKYPSEGKRKLYQFFLDVNPTGQMLQLTREFNKNMYLLPLYSSGILVVFTGAGLILFKKKSLK